MRKEVLYYVVTQYNTSALVTLITKNAGETRLRNVRANEFLFVQTSMWKTWLISWLDTLLKLVRVPIEFFLNEFSGIYKICKFFVQRIYFLQKNIRLQYSKLLN